MSKTQMSLIKHAVAIVLSFAMHLSIAQARPCANPDNKTQVTGGKECLVIKVFRSGEHLAPPVLFVVLHGDGSSGGPSTYHYRVAEQIARQARQDVVAVAMIRPGYYDNKGNTSTGSNSGRLDSYTDENIDNIADAIATLKSFYKAAQVVLIGHSGGAAISGVILGRHPRLVDAAVLVSCPCNVTEWRSMRGVQPWYHSESPSQYVKDVPPSTRVAAIIGSRDKNTFPVLSKTYVADLQAHGVTASFILVPNADHSGAFRSPVVIDTAIHLMDVGHVKSP